MPTSGIFTIDSGGNAIPFSAIPADDLEFDENGILYASNSEGIFRIEPDGIPVQMSTNPTSQFVFDSRTTVVAANGAAVEVPYVACQHGRVGGS